MRRYDQLIDIIRERKPVSIIEVGAHRGDRAERLCREALRHHPGIYYQGYDLFEEANDKTDAEEKNGKGHADMQDLHVRLSQISDLSFRIVRGNTRDTLHGKQEYADVSFIDGGHSVETIAGDYEALKGSAVTVFDDYYTSGVDTTKWGCNSLLANIPHELLPIEDRFGEVGIKLAVVRA